MAFVKKYYGLFLLLMVLRGYGCYQLIVSHHFKSLANTPNKGDIYIFKAESRYSPYLIDTVIGDSVYFFSHPYNFKGEVPSSNQILEDSFHHNIHYIYEQSEISRLIEEKVIINIYR